MRCIGCMCIVAIGAEIASGGPHMTPEPAQMVGLGHYTARPLLTIGESIDHLDGEPDYRPPGILDGIGAFELDGDTIRVLINHELPRGLGSRYFLANGTPLRGGARISMIDLDRESRCVVAGAIAYHTIIDGFGQPLDFSNFIAFGVVERLCSGSFAGPDQGLADRIFFAGEEIAGGREFALDVEARTLYELPALGNGAWENIAIIPTHQSPARQFTLAILADDAPGRPLYLWVGRKESGSDDFLARNGLRDGRLHTFVAENGANTNTEFQGTDSLVRGTWVPLEANRPLEDLGSFDRFGVVRPGEFDEEIDRADHIINMRNIVAEAGAIGGFFFSRPEDVSANPRPRRRMWGEVAFASTGRTGSLGDIDGDGELDFITDNWGTLYIAQVQLATVIGPGPILGRLRIAYDSNEPDKQDLGIRNPDNLDWSRDGWIYICEDRSASGFGIQSGIETSMWRLDPRSGDRERIAVMDRGAVPAGQSDFDPNDLGEWESSGILDVSHLFGEDAGRTLILDVQAHSVGGGDVQRFGLVQGGQLLLLERPEISACKGDLDGDGAVTMGDILFLLRVWARPDQAAADLDDNGAVGASDLLVILQHFGSCPGVSRQMTPRPAPR